MTRSDGSEGVAAWRPIAGTTWSAHISAPAAGYVAANKNAWTLLVVIVVLSLALLAAIVQILAHEMRLFAPARRPPSSASGSRPSAG